MTAIAWETEWKKLACLVAVVGLLFWLPIGMVLGDNALMEALHLAKWYAREHVVLCLVPAFFIAGAITVFISPNEVMRCLGPTANKVLAYSVASVSGTALAVCSCTVLPLFAGIYRMGAGLGPATTFLYAGPAINVLAIILTARILGLELGIARAVGAIVFSVVIGLIMHATFRREESAKAEAAAEMPQPSSTRPLWGDAVFLASLVAILVFANWGRPDQGEGIWYAVYSARWLLTILAASVLAVYLVLGLGVRCWKVLLAALPAVVVGFVFPHEPMLPFAAGVLGLSTLLAISKGRPNEWLGSSWTFTKQVMPLLLVGVLVAGALLGRPGHEGLIPARWVADLVGGNSIQANFFTSLVGAFMYFATLTEVPILQGLMGSGMGKGPALALLLAGPALSLPNMLVIQSIMGTKKTAVFASLVVVAATLTGTIYGALFG
jgi:uncharacterized membrane protein YraQ (UPF0718 family)